MSGRGRTMIGSAKEVVASA